MLKKLCQCLGLSSLLLVLNYGDLLGGGADARMHTPFPLTRLCFAQIADILFLALLLWVVLVALSRTRVYAWACLLIAIAVPPVLLERNQLLLPHSFAEGLIPLLALIWAAILLLLRFSFPRWFRGFMRVAGGVAAALAVFAITSIAQLLWVATWKPGPYQTLAAWAQAPQPPRQHPLVVWIVFDELSYDQVFEHRARDLDLPNFDALRAQSTLFTNTQPAGYHTVQIIPGLLSGHTVDGIRFDFHNRLSVHYLGQHGYHPLDGDGTVFGDAAHLGWRTAAVGWYNPYCTTYGTDIQDCYWMNRDMFDGPMAQRYSTWTNAVMPLVQITRELQSTTLAGRRRCDYDVRQRYLTETDLQEHAFRLLKTDQADFVFLHFAVPHSPNIWSRIDDAYAQGCDSSYLDNLALADGILGQVLDILRASPRWNSTALIVQGDHGWRINEWNWLPAWTAEDEEASRGVFDPRPAMIIHQPGQTQPQTVATPWPIIRIHTVMEQLLHGRPAAF